MAEDLVSQERNAHREYVISLRSNLQTTLPTKEELFAKEITYNAKPQDQLQSSEKTVSLQ